ncbi:S8 family serine peptidase [Saccharothrix variisporea]|uniref:Subtilisin family serine protease n=1 Tax=Saccharothrix variisporea TaxID=543527 RepID=A0A495XKT1_9PSEU|nr:S8 family serine peptidase [Saccharothrix variisporea]RKT73484.1 subtilisin family serine protease [Saccharothrix variisporea]
MGDFGTSWRRIAGVGATAAIAALGLSATPAFAQEVTIEGAGSKSAVEGSYIVVLKDRQDTDVVLRKNAVHVTHKYSAALNGFAAQMSEADAKRLAGSPAVAKVVQDQKITTAGTQTNPPSWGLDRIDQRYLPTNGTYNYANSAENVHAYVIDSGIRTTHTDFGGRATFDFNAFRTPQNPNEPDVDCNGHGTHVAGTLGGTSYGVAKSVRLHAVKVLNCQGSGSLAGVIAGIDWVTTNHVKPAVANMSLSGHDPDNEGTVLDDAVRRSIAAGVTYVTAASNYGDTEIGNACEWSPARVSQGITVGATNSTDARAYFSNWGSCVDIFAPGVSITSAYNTGDTATAIMDGTSMAAPHVAGAVAVYLSANPTATPDQVQRAVVKNATSGKVTDTQGSPNRLLFGSPTPDYTPVADRIVRGESLAVGQQKVSPNGQYKLALDADGSLVLRNATNAVVWHSQTSGRGGVSAELQHDGNFVLYTADGSPTWHTFTGGTAVDRIVVQDDGNVVAYGGSNYYWHRQLSTPAKDRVTRGQMLVRGETKVSPNGQYKLTLQTDGNLVLYNAAGQPEWHTFTYNSDVTRAELQYDGNFVLYSTAGAPRWYTGTNGTPSDRLVVQDDGNVVLYGGSQYYWHRRQ